MIVNATDIKNSFGKYIKLLDKEDIIVIRNGTPVAKITSCSDWDDGGRIFERAAAYGTNGKNMSYEEFIEMYENTDERYEYIDGKAYLLASPKVTHQRVLGNLYVLFRLWFKGKKCTPFLSPFDVTLKKSESNINVVQPDLLVVCDPENKNTKDKYTGVPALVVEILSDSSARMDMIKKLNLYISTGIEEYWIVNYIEKELLVYSFKDNTINDMKLYKSGDIVRSVKFEGFTADMNEIFE